MEEKNRFFRFLNRMNSILLALAGLAILFFIGGNLFFWPRYFEHPAAGLVHVEQADPNVSYTFGSGLSTLDATTISLLDGTSEAVMVLERDRNDRYGSFSSEGRGPSEDVNVLIVNAATGRSHWLFHGVKQSIGGSYPVHPAAAAAGATPAVIALLLAVATADTNHDNRIDRRDDESLYLYRPGMDRAVKLLAAKGISNVVQTGPEQVLVTYYDGKTDRLAIFSTADFKPIAQNAIASTPD